MQRETTVRMCSGDSAVVYSRRNSVHAMSTREKLRTNASEHARAVALRSPPVIPRAPACLQFSCMPVHAESRTFLLFFFLSVIYGFIYAFPFGKVDPCTHARHVLSVKQQIRHFFYFIIIFFFYENVFFIFFFFSLQSSPCRSARARIPEPSVRARARVSPVVPRSDDARARDGEK